MLTLLQIQDIFRSPSCPLHFVPLVSASLYWGHGSVFLSFPIHFLSFLLPSTLSDRSLRIRIRPIQKMTTWKCSELSKSKFNVIYGHEATVWAAILPQISNDFTFSLSKRPPSFSSFHKHLKDKNFKDNGDFSGGSAGKEPAQHAKDARDQGLIPGSERSPGERNATCSSILAWKTPWTEKHDRLQSMGSQSWTLSTSTHTKIMTPHFQSFCPLSVMATIQKADIQVIFPNLISHVELMLSQLTTHYSILYVDAYSVPDTL